MRVRGGEEVQGDARREDLLRGRGLQQGGEVRLEDAQSWNNEKGC